MKKLLTLLLVLLGFIFYGGQSFASSNDTDLNVLYERGISEGKINPNLTPLSDWIEENVEFKKSYDEGIEDNILDENISYETWIIANNYGQFYYEEPDETNNINSRVVIDNFNIVKGDILITNGTSSKGLTGHAAIATTNNYVLDMPGTGQPARQMTLINWVATYKKQGWVKIYRVPSGIKYSAADWADRNYWSTTGGYKRNIDTRYSIDGHLYQRNPSYCSKLVFQAFWYGSGNVPVIRNNLSGIVTPYGLVDTFTSEYKPTLKKTYK